MSLTREEVERVSLLARLELTEAELSQMTQQLGQILDYVDQLSELDTESVEPMAHAVQLTNVFGPDEVRPSLSRDEALGECPEARRRMLSSAGGAGRLADSAAAVIRPAVDQSVAFLQQGRFSQPCPASLNFRPRNSRRSWSGGELSSVEVTQAYLDRIQER